jgi:hypothetical protein
VFWERGAAELPPADWERITKQIEKVRVLRGLL